MASYVINALVTNTRELRTRGVVRADGKRETLSTSVFPAGGWRTTCAKICSCVIQREVDRERERERASRGNALLPAGVLSGKYFHRRALVLFSAPSVRSDALRISAGSGTIAREIGSLHDGPVAHSASSQPCLDAVATL